MSSLPQGMWRIMQQEEPEDFVLATGEVHSVREFVEAAFKEVQMISSESVNNQCQT